MSFTLNDVRQQFSALGQYHDGKPVTFFDGPGGSQVPENVLASMTEYLGHFNSNLGGHYFFEPEDDRLDAASSRVGASVTEC